MFSKKKTISLAAVSLLVGTNTSYAFDVQTRFAESLSEAVVRDVPHKELNLDLKISVDRELLKKIREISYIEELEEESAQVLLKSIKDALEKKNKGDMMRLDKEHNYDRDSMTAKIVF